MVADSLKYFNWVDILVIMISLKIIYTALNKGMVIEFFKLCGTIFTIYVSLHYYTNVSDWMRLHAGLTRMPLEFLDFLICLSLAVLSYIIFIFIRVVFARLVKM